MAVRETIKDSYYRSYDAENDAWIRHAFWTKASQVECNDGKDVETKITEEIDAKIQELEQSFQGGCSVIADAITGGRDGNGTGGVPTAADASLNTMNDNITAMALLNYNQGISFADGRVNTESASYTSGQDSVYSTIIANAVSDQGRGKHWAGTLSFVAPQTRYYIIVIRGTDYIASDGITISGVTSSSKFASCIAQNNAGELDIYKVSANQGSTVTVTYNTDYNIQSGFHMWVF